jgi:hypothetical protein
MLLEEIDEALVLPRFAKSVKRRLVPLALPGVDAALPNPPLQHPSPFWESWLIFVRRRHAAE